VCIYIYMPSLHSEGYARNRMDLKEHIIMTRKRVDTRWKHRTQEAEASAAAHADGKTEHFDDWDDTQMVHTAWPILFIVGVAFLLAS
jgi:hypothetical protein